jgi:hypothetical protein
MDHIREKGTAIMLRKVALALAACAALGTTALLPTSASAFWVHGWRHWGGPHIVVARTIPVHHGWCYYHPFRCGR